MIFDETSLVGCGSDGVVRIWEIDGERNVPRGQFGPPLKALKAVWTPVEFGEGVATMDEDGGVRVWRRDGDSWNVAASLGGSRATDLEFAPGRLGALLAVSCADGVARIYVFFDGWRQAASLACDEDKGTSCVSWHPSADVPAVCVGTTDAVMLWWRRSDEWHLEHTIVACEDDELVRDVAWSPRSPSDAYLVAVATSKRIVLCAPGKSALLSDDLGGGARTIGWNATGRLLAVSGDDDVCRVFKQDFHGTWVKVDECVVPSESPAPPLPTPGKPVDSATNLPREEAPPSFSFSFGGGETQTPSATPFSFASSRHDPPPSDPPPSFTFAGSFPLET